MTEHDEAPDRDPDYRVVRPSRDNTPVAVEQIDREAAIAVMEAQTKRDTFVGFTDLLAEAFASYRLRLGGQDRGEGLREALENIANGRQPSPSGSPLACTQLDEIRRYARSALSTQPPPVSDVREPQADWSDAAMRLDSGLVRYAGRPHSLGWYVRAGLAAENGSETGIIELMNAGAKALAHAAVGEEK